MLMGELLDEFFKRPYVAAKVPKENCPIRGGRLSGTALPTDDRVASRKAHSLRPNPVECRPFRTLLPARGPQGGDQPSFGRAAGQRRHHPLMPPNVRAAPDRGGGRFSGRDRSGQFSSPSEPPLKGSQQSFPNRSAPATIPSNVQQRGPRRNGISRLVHHRFPCNPIHTPRDRSRPLPDSSGPVTHNAKEHRGGGQRKSTPPKGGVLFLLMDRTSRSGVVT